MAFGFGGVGTSPAEGYGQAASSMGEAGIGNVGGKGASSSSSGPSSSSPAGGSQAASGYGDGSRDNSASSGPSASSPAGGSQGASGYGDGSRDASYGGGSDPGYSGGASPSTGGGLASALGEAGSGVTPSAREAENASMASLSRDASAVEAALGDRTPTGFTPSTGGLADALGYGQMASTMGQAGIGNVGGTYGTASTPSARQAQEESMASYYASSVPSARQAQEESMRTYNAQKAPTIDYSKLSRQEAFLADMYSAGLRAGLTDTQARVAATQAALETAFGRSVVGNNFFGIKAGRSWAGPTVNAKTWEEENGKRVNQRASFRSYSSPEESLQDWAGLVSSRWSGVMSTDDFSEAVKGFNAGKKGGYATDSQYESKLGSIHGMGQRAGVFQDNGRPASSVPTPTSRPDFADRYIGSPQSPTTPQTAPQADQPPSTQTVTVDQRPSQTLPGKIAAGAIDIGTGFIPGIGTALGVVNAGLSLSGNRTIGQHAVDLVGSGEGGGPVSPNTEAGSGLIYRDGEWYRPGEENPVDDGDEDEATGKKKPRSFADKYLRDEPKRPTPREKWGSRWTA